MLSATRQINGLVRLGETLRAVLDPVAVHEPEWLADWVPSEWFDRYAIRFEDTRLPKGKAKQAELIGGRTHDCQAAPVRLVELAVREEPDQRVVVRAEEFGERAVLFH
ncbi:hypothetical protein [Streptomyces cinerochromogenes]|uniref:hypothetical protein n=1 Tax=Streptomyces cinerochromogenes TaxID=66422 RepID=UPI0033A16482